MQQHGVAVSDGYVDEGGQDENEIINACFKLGSSMVSDCDPRHGKTEVHGLFHAVQGRSDQGYELACACFQCYAKKISRTGPVLL